MDNEKNMAQETVDASRKTVNTAKTAKNTAKAAKEAGKLAAKAAGKLVSALGLKVIVIALAVILLFAVLTNGVPATSFNSFTHQNENQLTESELNNRESVQKDLSAAEKGEAKGINVIAKVFKEQKAGAYDKLEELCNKYNVDYDTSLTFLESNFIEIGAEMFKQHNKEFYTEEEYDAIMVLSTYSISVDNLMTEQNIGKDTVSRIEALDISSTVERRAKKVYDILIDENCTPEAACGILGNLMAESGLRPNATSADGYGSYGIAQWTGGRKTNLINYCNSHGYSYTTLEGQAHYLVHEINSDAGFAKLDKCNWSGDLSYLRCSEVIPGYSHPGMTGKKLKKMTSIEKVAVIWINHHERPAAGKYHNEDKRIAYAKGFYERFTNRNYNNNNAGDEISSGKAYVTIPKQAVDVITLARKQIGKGDIFSAEAIKAGHGAKESWCGRFVWYCFYKSGNEKCYYSKDEDNFTGNPTKLKNWAEKNSRLITKDKARPGDIFVNISSTNHHTGLIEYIDKEGNIHTIEKAGNKVARKKRASVGYYIRPAYNEFKTATLELPAAARDSAGETNISVMDGTTTSGKKHWTVDMYDKLTEYLSGEDLYTIRLDEDEDGKVIIYDTVVDKNNEEDLSDDVEDYKDSINDDVIDDGDSSNDPVIGIDKELAAEYDDYKNSVGFQQSETAKEDSTNGRLRVEKFIQAEMVKKEVEDIALNAFELDDAQTHRVYGNISYSTREIIREMTYNELALLHGVTDPENDLILAGASSSDYEITTNFGDYKVDFYCGCDKTACANKRKEMLKDEDLSKNRKRVKGVSCTAFTNRFPVGTVLYLEDYGLLVVDDALKRSYKDTIAIYIGDKHNVNVANKIKEIEDKRQLNLVTGLKEANAKNMGTAVATGKLQYPLGDYKTYISSPYGWRIHPIRHTKSFHTGIDLPAPGGTPITASDGGTVLEARYAGSYGNMILLKHSDNMTTRYAHCSSLNVKKGQQVSKGQIIGKVGTTGSSTGNHLHYEVIIDGETSDPMKYIKLP